MKKIFIRVTCVMLLLFLFWLIAVKGLLEQTQERIYYGETKKWQNWTDYLFSATQEQDYAYAFAWVDDWKADFIWKFYDARESLVEDLLAKKESMLQKEKNGTVWCFVKLRLSEDIHGTDIYEYMEQNLSEEGDEYSAYTFTKEEWDENTWGDSYYIEQNRIEYYLEENPPYRIRCTKKEAIICDGYLYFLTCENITEENKYTLTEQFDEFNNQLNSNYGMAYCLDGDRLYWLDHTERVSKFENPDRTFIEIRADDLGGAWGAWNGYFGMLKEAEYRIRLSPDLPEMTIHFQISEDKDVYGYELSNFNWTNEDTYRMEVRMAEDCRLLQEGTVKLSVWNKDMINFEDLDGDGYLDMKIVYPEYESSDDSLAFYDEVYLLWNQETEEFKHIKQATLLAMQEENNTPPTEEETDMDLQTMPYTLTFIVQKGDSLWKLAKKYYLDGNRWQEIYECNQEVIGEDPSLILPGMELEIP
ncbi:MAG: LysM peptidoglycan-binding domain-containing protein [Lachnospiraceae bacterium]|nr:LysM peptidoglycan-binding domain-containing protein [Lachnospiraceae bacterium]